MHAGCVCICVLLILLWFNGWRCQKTSVDECIIEYTYNQFDVVRLQLQCKVDMWSSVSPQFSRALDQFILSLTASPKVVPLTDVDPSKASGGFFLSETPKSKQKSNKNPLEKQPVGFFKSGKLQSRPNFLFETVVGIWEAFSRDFSGLRK